MGRKAISTTSALVIGLLSASVYAAGSTSSPGSNCTATYGGYNSLFAVNGNTQALVFTSNDSAGYGVACPLAGQHGPSTTKIYSNMRMVVADTNASKDVSCSRVWSQTTPINLSGGVQTKSTSGNASGGKILDFAGVTAYGTYTVGFNCTLYPNTEVRMYEANYN